MKATTLSLEEWSNIKKQLFKGKESNFLINLYYRWLDEKAFEDIKEYKIAIEKNIKLVGFNYKIVKMNKRPFGFDFQIRKQIFTLYMKNNTLGIKFLRNVL